MTSAGELLRTLREQRRVSQEDVALAAGLSDGAVWQWEAGRTTPRRAVAFKVDRFLGADGELAGAWGYALPSDESGQVEELRAEISQLRAVVAALGQAMVESVSMSTEAQRLLAERLADLQRAPADKRAAR